jgi:AraC-like DNA-binding protein
MIDWMILMAAVSAVAVTQSIFLGAINIVNGRRGAQSSIYLGLLLIALGIRVAKSLVYYYWPGIAIVGVALGGAGLWAAGPSLFLYLRSSTGKVISRNENILYYLPAVLVFILGSTIFKMQWMRLVYLSGCCVVIIGLVASFVIYQRHKSNDKNHWLLAVQLGVLVMITMFIYQLYSPNIQAYAWGAIVASVVLYFINFKGMGLHRVATTVQSSKNQLDENQLQMIGNELTRVFEKEHVYREQKLTLSKLAERINTPQYLLRKAIQQLHNKNFNDFINEYRVAELCDRLKRDNKFTIEAMASEVGFTSNSTFYEAFRKVMGCTPAEYRKKITADNKYPSELGALTRSQPI